MKSNIYRTCRVNKWGETFSICELHYVNNKYVVIVLEDTDDLFVDFNLEIGSNKSADIAIKYFEAECINRFTCYGDFSLIAVKENSGEEILFY
jgi:hypothetical protein